MAPNKNKQVNYTAKDIFNSAKSFFKAFQAVSSRLSTTDDVTLFAPIITLDAFCIELYLKCLYMIENSRPFHHNTHDLYTLYMNISEDSRGHIKTLHQFIAENDQQVKQLMVLAGNFSLELEGVLSEIRGTFLNWRYNYEKNINGFPTGHIILMAVRERILDLNPTWR